MAGRALLLAAAAVAVAGHGALAARFEVRDASFTTGADRAVLKVVADTATGALFSVIVNHGGSVEDLVLRSSRTGGLKRVIWSHSGNATAVRLNADWRGRMLCPYGNRIGGATYVFNGTRFYLPVNDVAGLNNSLHGLLWNRSMEVVATSATDAAGSVTLRYDFDGSDRGYPFRLRVDITYTLSSDGEFGFRVEASNLDPTGWPLPFYNGWHPYFLCNASASTVTLDPCTPWLHVDVGTGPQYPPPRHSNMVPTTHTRPYTRFNGSQPVGGTPAAPTYFDEEVKAAVPSGACQQPARGGAASFTTRLHDPGSGDTIALRASSPYRYLQVWTGAMSTFGEDAVVLEPLSAMSDGFNNHDGLHIISPGQRFSADVAVALE